jgi:DNA repair protein RadC
MSGGQALTPDQATYLNPEGTRSLSGSVHLSPLHLEVPMTAVTPLRRSRNRLSAIHRSTLNDEEHTTLIELALEVLAAKHQRGVALGCPEDTKAYLRLRFGEGRREVFGVLFLDTKHRVLGCDVLCEGTIDSAAVYPRTVVEHTLAYNAAALVLFHNHPSGVADPSRVDQLLTQRLKDALQLIDVRVLDHLIVTATDATSFAEKGLI